MREDILAAAAKGSVIVLLVPNERMLQALSLMLESDVQDIVPSVEAKQSNIFKTLEREFGRLLTPMEIETISGWIDEDHHSEDLIRAAVKEAVFAGKLHFRYVDRILLDWSRNKILTVNQAKEHAEKFRGRKE